MPEKNTITGFADEHCGLMVDDHLDKPRLLNIVCWDVSTVQIADMSLNREQIIQLKDALEQWLWDTAGEE